MIAALATLVFLASLLTLAGIAALMIEERGAWIRSALAGRSPLALRSGTARAPMRVSSRVRSQRPVRAHARLRAAA